MKLRGQKLMRWTWGFWLVGFGELYDLEASFGYRWKKNDQLHTVLLRKLEDGSKLFFLKGREEWKIWQKYESFVANLSVMELHGQKLMRWNGAFDSLDPTSWRFWSPFWTQMGGKDQADVPTLEQDWRWDTAALSETLGRWKFLQKNEVWWWIYRVLIHGHPLDTASRLEWRQLTIEENDSKNFLVTLPNQDKQMKIPSTFRIFLRHGRLFQVKTTGF